MRPPRVRFTIRWLMETTAIVAIVFWLFQSPAAVVFSIVFFGVVPLRARPDASDLRFLPGAPVLCQMGMGASTS